MTNTIRRPARVRLRSAALDTKLLRPRRRRSTRTEATPEAPFSAPTVIPEAAVASEPTVPLGRTSKSDIVITKLQTGNGVSIPDLMDATGWQAHSVRGFLSAVVRKKRGLNLVSDVGSDGERRYRIDAAVAAV